MRKKKRDPLAGKRDPVSQLYRAVRRYVEHNGGSVAVIGGIAIGQENIGRLNYDVRVRITGRLPEFARPADSANGDNDAQAMD